jgi:uncharacterized protein (TIGR03086 family)
MSQQTQPNPVALFEGASSRMAQLLAGVKSDHLNSPTPCSEWTVNDLIGHIQGGAEGLAAKLSGSSPAGAQGGSDAVASYKAAVSRTLEAAKDPANLEKSVEAGGNEMPGGQFLSIMFLDHLVHCWDLAKATGQDTVMDPALVDACYGMFVPAIDQFRSDRFGAAVTVSGTASTHDKLIAFMGRQP